MGETGQAATRSKPVPPQIDTGLTSVQEPERTRFITGSGVHLYLGHCVRVCVCVCVCVWTNKEVKSPHRAALFL